MLSYLLVAATRIKPHGIVPEQLAAALFGHLPGHDTINRLWKIAFAMRIVRAEHQHMLAEKIDGRIRHLLSLENIYALEVPSAQCIFAGFMLRVIRHGH